EIDFHVAQFRKYVKPDYQFQLIGMYDDWTEWSEETSVTFENLPYGDYTFKVRARVGDILSTNTASYVFRIDRPWYLSRIMWAIYVLVTSITLFMVHRTYRRYYHGKQNQLIEQNQQELELIRLQNEKEIINLKNDQLREDFRNKSNELAASTMSIIKKNELLTRVKEQLLESDGSSSTRKIVNIIDRSLKHNDDWELFQEAFNNADREFLGKLKIAHPNLTPNDIRLSSYLRLNLSSKEIAKLLHISPRSVEIKRYRLRKKMDLSHDENLVNYILQL
ncbi:MAG: two component regulator three y domain-containing protein, partial [Saprospiraceae bacterium]|nr:two component regulator three y domain-containing protein [Saprospiraceae bacterium]